MIAEFRRLQQLKQSFIPTQAYSMPPEEIEALAERQRAAAEEEAAMAANARMQSTRAPGMVPASELRSGTAPSDPDPVVGAAPLPAASSSTSSASQEDEVEDESDDETLHSRSQGSTVARSRTVKRIGRTNGSAVAADDPNSKIVMSKFVEYEAGKKRGVLSKVRELRKARGLFCRRCGHLPRLGWPNVGKSHRSGITRSTRLRWRNLGIFQRVT